jgi:hypothetical protein
MVRGGTHTRQTGVQSKLQKISEAFNPKKKTHTPGQAICQAHNRRKEIKKIQERKKMQV